MIIGGLWYSPMLFGNSWMKLSGMNKQKLQKAKKGMGKTYFIAFISSLVMSYVLAIFVNYAQAVTIVDGAMVGFWVWLGFIATVTLGSILWEGKSTELYAINNSQYLVNLLVMGAILAVWV